MNAKTIVVTGISVAAICLAMSGCDSDGLSDEEYEAQYEAAIERKREALSDFATEYRAVTDWEQRMEEKYGDTMRYASTFALQDALCIGQPVLMELVITDVSRTESGQLLVFCKQEDLRFSIYAPSRFLRFELVASTAMEQEFIGNDGIGLELPIEVGGQHMVVEIESIESTYTPKIGQLQLGHGTLLGLFNEPDSQ